MEVSKNSKSLRRNRKERDKRRDFLQGKGEGFLKEREHKREGNLRKREIKERDF